MDDVLVIGGGASGLNAALILSRARRRVLVVDSGRPRNAPAQEVHGFVSRDGTPPAELLAAGRAEVERYGGRVVAGEVRTLRRDGAGFEAELAEDTVRARRVIVATGLRDELPDVPGLRERWARDVLHCPYCHGWEVRDQPLGVLGWQPRAVHQALLVRQYSDDVVFFAEVLDTETLDDGGRAKLAARGVRIVDTHVSGLVIENDKLRGVRLADGSVVARSALFVPPRFVPQRRPTHRTGLRTGRQRLGAGGSGRADQRAGCVGGRQRGGLPRPGGDRGCGRCCSGTRGEPGPDRGRVTGAGAMSDIDWAAMADVLECEGEAHNSYVRQAVEELTHLSPRRILDVGSGPGVVACQLAEVFPQAEVTAVDGTPELLARAEERAKRLGVRLHTQLAQLPEGLAELPPAELVWSAQVVHHVGDQQSALNRLARLLNPGGVLAIVEGGLPARWLPRELGFGRPGLHARLDAAMEDGFSRMRAELPGSVAVVEDWIGMLRAAGLTEVRSKTFLVDHPVPLAQVPRQSVRHSLERRRAMLSEHLDAEDLASLDRLLDPADPAGVDRRADLFLLIAKTVHFGRRTAPY